MGLRCTRCVAASRPSAAAVCGKARRLAPLCACVPTERALWPRARFVSIHVPMLRLTLELSGDCMRRTPTVAVVANGASASLFDWAVAASSSRRTLMTPRASSGRNRRRHCIRHGRNRAGQPAVCRRSLRNGASRRHPCLLPLSTPVSTDASPCCFSAATCVQVVTRAFGTAQKLPPPVAEAMTTSGACMRALSAFAGVSRRFKRALAQAGVRAHILACLLLLCACR